MSEITYKPYAIITEEWANICARFSAAQSQYFEAQKSLLLNYPPDKTWKAYCVAVDQYDAIRKEMDLYRTTVRGMD